MNELKITEEAPTEEKEIFFNVKFSLKQTLAVGAVLLSIIGGAVGVGYKVQDTINTIRTNNLIADYDKKINVLGKQLQESQELNKKLDAQFKAAWDDRQFLKLYLSYETAKRSYSVCKTSSNKELFEVLIYEFIDYVKQRQLQSNVSYTFEDNILVSFTDKIKYIDGIPFSIPYEILKRIK